MSFRFKWAFQQAMQSTITFTVLLLFAAAIFMGAHPEWNRAAALCLLLIVPPILVRFRHFYDAFTLTTITSIARGMVLEIGHYTEFTRRYRFEQINGHLFIGHVDPTAFGERHISALMFDNGLLVVVDDDYQLRQVHALLREQWVYWPLVANCNTCEPKTFWSNKGLPFAAEIA